MRIKVALQRIVLVSFLFLSVKYTFSQEEGFTNFSVNEGLPSSQVYRVIKGPVGNLWFLTDKGISKYDGYSFENFSEIDGLSDNIFFNACISDSGNIWLLAKNGSVSIVDPIHNSFTKYRYNHALKDNRIEIPQRIALENGHVLIKYINSTDYLEVSTEGEVLKVPKTNLPLRKYYLNIEGGIHFLTMGKNANSSEIDWSKIIYRSFGFYLENESVRISNTDIDSVEIRRAGRSQKIYVKNSLLGGEFYPDQFWISSVYNGISIFDKAGKYLGSKLKGYTVTDVYVDPSGIIWYCTLNKGLFRENNYFIKKLEPKYKEDNYVYNMVKTPSNQLYISYYNGNISRIDDRSENRLYQRKNGSISFIDFNNLMKDVMHISNGTLLGLTSEQGLEGIVSNSKFFYELSNGDIISCNSNGVKVYSLKNNKITVLKKRLSERMYSAIEFKEEVWLAGESGLYKSLENGFYEFELTDKHKGRINSLNTFRDYIVLATNGSGLKLVKSDGEKIRIKPKLFESKFINSTYTENDSTLWVCSNKGLSKISFEHDIQSYSVKSFNQTHGLSCSEVRQITIINDTVWVGATEGLFYFDKNAVSNAVTETNCNLHIQNVLVNDEQDYSKGPIELSHSMNKVFFKFTAISLANSNTLLYRYKLDGAESKWNYSKNRNAFYSNLQPGNYNFKVQVKNGDNLWSKSQSFLLNIAPPFYKTWWFVSALIITVVVLIYFFFRLRILLYNKDMVREIMRYFLRLLRRDKGFIVVKVGTKEVKIFCDSINYVKSDGNYVEIHHAKGKTLARLKISEFLDTVPDPLEFLQIRRSFIVRLDKVEQKGKKEVTVAGKTITVGSTFIKALENIKL